MNLKQCCQALGKSSLRLKKLDSKKSYLLTYCRKLGKRRTEYKEKDILHNVSSRGDPLGSPDPVSPATGPGLYNPSDLTVRCCSVPGNSSRATA